MGRHQISPPTDGQLAYARHLIGLHCYLTSTAAIEAVSRAGKEDNHNTPTATVRRAHQADKETLIEFDTHEMSNLIAVLEAPAKYGITTPRDKTPALSLIEHHGYRTSTEAIEAIARAGDGCCADAPVAIVRRAFHSGKILLDELTPYEIANLIGVLERPSVHGICTPTQEREEAPGQVLTAASV